MNSESTPHRENPLQVRSDSLLANARAVASRSETLRFLVASELKSGHRDKVLGNLWNLLDPLLFLGVYFLVFGIGLRQAGDDPTEFILYLAIGVLAFRFTDGCITQAATCIRANRGIIEQLPFPKALLPIAVCACRLYDYGWSLVVLAGVLLAMSHPLTAQLAWTPVFVALQFLFSLGVAFGVAYMGAFFADTSNIVAVGSRLLFFGSPICYFARSEPGHPGIVAPEYLAYYNLNPLAGLLDSYRDVLLWGRMPAGETALYVVAIAIASLFLGFALFTRGERHFAKYL